MTIINKTIYIAIVVLICTGCASNAIHDVKTDPHSAVKSTWSTQIMLKDINMNLSSIDSTYILTWLVMEDERPLYVESCILYINDHNNSRPCWWLLHLYRHPKGHCENDKIWHYAVVMDLPVIFKQQYTNKPTEADIETFLKKTQWHLEPQGGFRVLEAGIDQAAWKLCFDVLPPEYLVKQLR